MDEEKEGKKVKIGKRLLHWYSAHWHRSNKGYGSRPHESAYFMGITQPKISFCALA